MVILEFKLFLEGKVLNLKNPKKVKREQTTICNNENEPSRWEAENVYIRFSEFINRFCN